MYIVVMGRLRATLGGLSLSIAAQGHAILWTRKKITIQLRFVLLLLVMLCMSDKYFNWK